MGRARGFLDLHHGIDPIADGRARADLLEQLRNPTRPYVVSFVNAHAANLAWTTPATLDCFLRSDLLLRDGVGVALSLRVLGCRRGVNMNGTDLIPEITRAYAGRRAALFGTCSPWLERARRRLEAHGLIVVACADGFAPAEAYLELAAAAEPDLVVLAMGMPKQEAVAVRLAEELHRPTLIVNGGAILDFLGGRVPRAPRIMQRTGTEWLYRLYLEPRRLAARYLVGIPVFFSRVAVTRILRSSLEPGLS